MKNFIVVVGIEVEAEDDSSAEQKVWNFLHNPNENTSKDFKYFEVHYTDECIKD